MLPCIPSRTKTGGLAEFGATRKFALSWHRARCAALLVKPDLHEWHHSSFSAGPGVLASTSRSACCAHRRGYKVSIGTLPLRRAYTMLVASRVDSHPSLGRRRPRGAGFSSPRAGLDTGVVNADWQPVIARRRPKVQGTSAGDVTQFGKPVPLLAKSARSRPPVRPSKARPYRLTMSIWVV